MHLEKQGTLVNPTTQALNRKAASNEATFKVKN